MSEPFRDLCETSSELMQCIAADGRFSFVNQAWCDALGYSAEEATRLGFLEIVDEDERERVGDLLRPLMRGGPACSIETILRSRHGDPIRVAGTAAGLARASAAPEVCLVLHDRPDPGRQSVRELERLFNLSLDLLCVAGTDGFFKRINPAFEQVLGYTRDELMSRPFLDFVHPDDRSGTLEQLENLKQGELVVDFRNRYRAHDGSYRWLAWRSAPLADHGLVYACARDVTADIHGRELLARRTEDLSRSNADLEQFAYAASHDLRAPLRQVGQLAEWIGEALEAGGTEEASRHLTRLTSRVRRMQSLIDDLLEYARAGKRAGELSRVDTGRLVLEVVRMLTVEQGFEVRVEPGMPVLVTVKAPLEQVLRNLIGNALRHHDGPPGRIAVSARARSGGWEFSVSDDGPGIPDDQRQKVFEMFYRLRSQDRGGGAGIGLALVQRLVRSVGGRVWVAASDGRGATFRFTWPDRAHGEPAAGG